MDRYQETVDRLSVVKRWLTPIFADDPLPGRRRRFALGKEDFELVAYGAACPACLACWEPLILNKCPACGHERNAQDLEADIRDWQEYLRERKRILEDENPVRTEIARPDQIVDAIAAEHFGKWVPGTKRNL